MRLCSSAPRALCASAALLACLLSCASARAETQHISAIGQGGWKSDDTRAARETPNDLVGVKSTHTFCPVKPATAEDDEEIAKMLVFIDEAGGAPAGASEGGALLITVPSEPKRGAGKVTLSNSNPKGFVQGGDWIKTFKASYRWQGKSAALPIKISFQTPRYGKGPGQSQNGFKPQRTGDALVDYTLVYEPNTYQKDEWVVDTIDGKKGEWRLFRQHGNPNLPPVEFNKTQTLEAWAADPTFGPLLFAPTSKVVSIQTGIGSGGFGDAYLDWIQVSLLNGGDKIVFGPLPAKAK
ncbi:MAG: hypothetical protein NTW19_22380 [Planctomycetota bacterium]|nr:hypothetical protein [Planctomycetota bacterium]